MWLDMPRAVVVVVVVVVAWGVVGVQGWVGVREIGGSDLSGMGLKRLYIILCTRIYWVRAFVRTYVRPHVRKKPSAWHISIHTRSLACLSVTY